MAKYVREQKHMWAGMKNRKSLNRGLRSFLDKPHIVLNPHALPLHLCFKTTYF